jgi:uncharacterized membrane protein YedE/YeeE
MTASTILQALLGGVLIGAAASGLLLVNGRLAGISSIAGGLVSPPDAETPWRLSFFLGLLAGGALLLLAYPAAFPVGTPHPLGQIALAGLLVGLGTSLASGCTSGHGVCGLSRRSPRSLAATLTFMATGAATVFLVTHLWSRG